MSILLLIFQAQNFTVFTTKFQCANIIINISSTKFTAFIITQKLQSFFVTF